MQPWFAENVLNNINMKIVHRAHRNFPQCKYMYSKSLILTDWTT